MLAALFIAAGSTTSLAQAGCDDTEKINELDAKIRANYNKKATRKIAIDAGKEFLEKFGSCEASAEFTTWLKGQMPDMEKRYAQDVFEAEMGALFKRFDAGITSDNADEVFSAGSAILAKQPDNLNIMVPMAMTGILQVYKNNNKYADESVRLGKTIIAKLKGGAEATKKNPQGVGTYGALKLEYTKEEAIDELSYGTAYITYAVKKDMKTALPMYYDLTQTSNKYKNEPRVFGAIGDYYVAEAGKLGQEIAAMIEKQKTLPTDEEKVKFDAEIKAKVGLFNGYTERAIDAFARAHKVAPTATAADKTYKDKLFQTIQELYKRRFDKDAAMTGLNQYIASAVAKPFPNPTSEVTPVVDPDPVTTTTTTGGVGAASGTGAGAASGTGIGAASGKGVGAAGTTAKTAAPTAKPVAKKP